MKNKLRRLCSGVCCLLLLFAAVWVGAGHARVPGKTAGSSSVASSGISPTLGASTFLGGSGEDEIDGIALDARCNVYVVGTTSSPNLPVTAQAFQKTLSSNGDHVFVAKLNPAGTQILYLTYLGGSRTDQALGIAVDADGNAYVVGTTESADFPTTPGAFQRSFGGGSIFGDGFVAKLDPTGSTLVYSTYLGGSNDDEAVAIAVDGLGNAYVAGATRSSNFPVTPGALQTSYAGGASNVAGAGGDGFVAKLNATGSALQFATYLGGSSEESVGAIALDGSGNVVVAGRTSSADFPVTSGAVQSTYAGGTGPVGGDAFVTKLNPIGTALVFSTFLGGSADDGAGSVEVDSAGNVYVQGGTGSSNFPTANALQPTLAGKNNAFLAKLDPAGHTFAYSTYLGGVGTDYAKGIADAAGTVYITGYSDSSNFPLISAFQPYFGNDDVVVARVDAQGATLVYSSYLGGGDADFGNAIARDPVSGTIWIGGSTFSQDFPVLNALQSTRNGGMTDAFLTQIAEIPTPAPGEMADLHLSLSADQSSISNGGTVHFTITVNNDGPASAENVVAGEYIPLPLTASQATATQGACTGSAYASCNLGELAAGGSASITITAGVSKDSAITMEGPLVTTAHVVSTTADPGLANNSAQTIVSLKIQGTTGGGSGGSGCFIATAAYGSYLDPHVQVLREFRDRHLLTNTVGHLFVAWYYRHSPPVAAVVARSAFLRRVTRWALTPVVLAVEHPGWSVLLMGLLTFAAVVWHRMRGIHAHSASARGDTASAGGGSGA